MRSQGEVVDYLGTFNSPWEVEVSLQSGGNGAALLLGTTTMTFVNGSASFTNLIINQPDDGYVLHFTVVQPAEASNYTLDTLPFQVCSLFLSLSLCLCHCLHSVFFWLSWENESVQ